MTAARKPSPGLRLGLLPARAENWVAPANPAPPRRRRTVSRVDGAYVLGMLVGLGQAEKAAAKKATARRKAAASASAKRRAALSGRRRLQHTAGGQPPRSRMNV